MSFDSSRTPAAASATCPTAATPARRVLGFGALLVLFFAWLASAPASFALSSSVLKPENCDPNTLSSGRGRPVVSNGTLLTDTGNLLRGVFWSTDLSNPRRPTPQEWAAADLAGRGLNALHLYAERPGENKPAGYNKCVVDQMVKLTASSGMYLVITIGDTGHQAEYIADFWEVYAPRYRDLTHVIFEVKNESWFASPPASQLSREANRDGYQEIRSHAPDSPVLLFSYAFFENPAGVLADLAWMTMNAGVDWSKTGVAFHGYSGAAATRTTLEAVTAAGYAVMETEGTCPITDPPTCAPQNGPWFPLLDVWETTRTSWLAFIPLLSLSDTTFDDQLEAESVIWVADSGIFPGSSNPPTGSVVTLESPVNGRYARLVAGDRLQAGATSQGPETLFSVVTGGPYGNFAALRSEQNGKYLRPVASDGDRLVADAASPHWFEWIDRPDGQVSLRDTGTWRFVSNDFNLSSPPPVVANRVRGGDSWEAFEIDFPSPTGPTVTLLEPVAGQVFASGDLVTVEASVSHPQGVAITRVDFHYGTQTKSRTAPPWRETFSSAGQAHNSTQQVYARAFDAGGESTQSAAVTIRFDALAPSVSITEPTSGQTVSGTVTVKASASDGNGVAAVDFLVDGAVRHTDTTAPYTFPWDTSGDSDGNHTLTARARDVPGNERLSAGVGVVVDNAVSTPMCQPSTTTLCLQNNRFAVTLFWENQHGGTSGPGQKENFSNQTGLFWFFNAQNIETLVKIIDGRAVNDYWWLYFGGLTDVEYTLDIEDTLTGATRSFNKPPGSYCGQRTTTLFFDDGSNLAAPETKAAPETQPTRIQAAPAFEASVFEASVFEERRLELPAGPRSVESGGEKAGSCVPSNQKLCLQNNRFEVTVTWTDYQGATGSGTSIPDTNTDQAGYFWFFNNQNVELGVKVVDGTGINGHWWVYYGSLTDVDFTLTVTDKETGNVAQYVNPLGTYCGDGDSSALPE